MASLSVHPPHQELGNRSTTSPSAHERIGEKQTDRETHSSLHPPEIRVVLDVSSSSPWTRQRLRHYFGRTTQWGGQKYVKNECLS